MDDKNSTAQDRTGIPRRTIMKGAAWSIPAIAVAVAAPAASASTTCTTSVGIFSMDLYPTAVHNGEPLYRANDEPFVDLVLANVGDCDLAAGAFYVQISQPSALIPNYVGVASGWNMIGTATTSDGIAYIRLANASPLPAGAQMPLRQYLHVAGVLPAGYTRDHVVAQVVATNNQNGQITGERFFYTQG